MTPGEEGDAELICERRETTDHLNELEAKPKGDMVTLGSLHTWGTESALAILYFGEKWKEKVRGSLHILVVGVASATEQASSAVV